MTSYLDAIWQIGYISVTYRHCKWRKTCLSNAETKLFANDEQFCLRNYHWPTNEGLCQFEEINVRAALEHYKSPDDNPTRLSLKFNRLSRGRIVNDLPPCNSGRAEVKVPPTNHPAVRFHACPVTIGV